MAVGFKIFGLCVSGFRVQAAKTEMTAQTSAGLDDVHGAGASFLLRGNTSQATVTTAIPLKFIRHLHTRIMIVIIMGFGLLHTPALWHCNLDLGLRALGWRCISV